MTVRKPDDAEARFMVYEGAGGGLRGGLRAWAHEESTAIEVAKVIASDPDTRGLVYVLELKAVIS